MRNTRAGRRDVGETENTINQINALKQWRGGAWKDENTINQIEETPVRIDQWKQNRRI
jgi:hypothetical protein